jgi:hypothetical protein
MCHELWLLSVEYDIREWGWVVKVVGARASILS